jgi:hypothetical protein
MLLLYLLLEYLVLELDDYCNSPTVFKGTTLSTAKMDYYSEISADYSLESILTIAIVLLSFRRLLSFRIDTTLEVLQY